MQIAQRNLRNYLYANRYANHKKSFNAKKNKNDTKLFTEYWKPANKKFHPQTSWSIKEV